MNHPRVNPPPQMSLSFPIFLGSLVSSLTSTFSSSALLNRFSCSILALASTHSSHLFLPACRHQQTAVNMIYSASKSYDVPDLDLLSFLFGTLPQYSFYDRALNDPRFSALRS